MAAVAFTGVAIMIDLMPTLLTTSPAPNDRPCLVERVIELARWAPSGDNSQPWRFEIAAEHHVVVRGFDTRQHCVYDLDGRPSQLAIGAMLETLRIGASGEGCRAEVTRRRDTPEQAPVFDVLLAPDSGVVADPLLSCVRTRSVQRRGLSMRALSQAEAATLEAAVGAGFRIHWIGGVAGRWRAACLMFRNAGIRLTLPEAFETHRRVIEWNASTSDDRIPDRAIGLDPLATRLMQWVMAGGWRRVAFFNTWLAGTLLPRVELDLLPGLRCAAHFVIIAERPAQTIDDQIAAGAAVQRFWLTAAKLGLQLQPELTPLIFARYVHDGLSFTVNRKVATRAALLVDELRDLVAPHALERAVFIGRLGAGAGATARSLRLAVDRLVGNERERALAGARLQK